VYILQNKDASYIKAISNPLSSIPIHYIELKPVYVYYTCNTHAYFRFTISYNV